MSPFLKVMQLFLMMTGTVLGMLVLLLVTPDFEDSILRAIRRYQRNHHFQPIKEPEFIEPEPQLVDSSVVRSIRPMVVELDRSRKKYSPWPNSEECGRYRIHFAKQKSLPMTALVSFPGSGNTWVRYLIETSSGVFTGSVYTDRNIISKGFYGEAVPPDCGCTAVQNTHGFALAGLVPKHKEQRSAEITLFRGRGILLMRNPYEALLSYRNYLYGGHTGVAPEDRFKGHDWEIFASGLAIVWKELAATWINNTRQGDITVLHFEQVKQDPREAVRSMLNFLGIATDEHRLSCVVSHVDGPFRRPRSLQEASFRQNDPFSNKLHRILDSVIDDVDELLERRRWDRAPRHLYKFHNTSPSNH